MITNWYPPMCIQPDCTSCQDRGLRPEIKGFHFDTLYVSIKLIEKNIIVFKTAFVQRCMNNYTITELTALTSIKEIFHFALIAQNIFNHLSVILTQNPTPINALIASYFDPVEELSQSLIRMVGLAGKAVRQMGYESNECEGYFPNKKGYQDYFTNELPLLHMNMPFHILVLSDDHAFTTPSFDSRFFHRIGWNMPFSLDDPIDAAYYIFNKSRVFDHNVLLLDFPKGSFADFLFQFSFDRLQKFVKEHSIFAKPRKEKTSSCTLM